MSGRRKKVSLPAKPQLGEPGNLREMKSVNGFEREQLAAGAGEEGGMLRARERAPMTPPALVREMVESVLGEMRLKRALTRADYVAAHESIYNRLTAIDHTLSSDELWALWMMISTHARLESGHAAITNYTGVDRRGGGEDGHEGRDAWRDAVSAYEYVWERLTLSQQDFLDDFAWQNFPAMREGRPKTANQLGKEFVGKGSEDSRIHQGAYRARVRELAISVKTLTAEWRIEQARKLWMARKRLQEAKRDSMTATEYAVIMPEDFYSERA